ncbi:unnamed protein product, partial [Ostreobium quekettii]
TLKISGAGVYESKCYSLGIVPSTQVLRNLKKENAYMDHCRFGREGAEAFGCVMALNNVIKRLSLVDCSLDSKANDVLEKLYLDGNPLGDSGARHLMHALRENKSVKFLGLQGSNMTSAVVEGQAHAAQFNPACPDGSYELDLSDQTERAVAVQLCQLDNAADDDFMRNVKLDKQSISSIKALDWPDRLPTVGTLTVDYVTIKTRRVMHVIDQKKLAALEAQFCKPAMSDTERSSLVSMFAPYHFFLCHQIGHMLQSFTLGDERVDAAVVLFARAVDTDVHLNALLEPLHERERRQFLQLLGFYAYYVFTNPTGHYELNLTTPAHRHIANRIKDAALAEPENLVWKNIVFDKYSEQTRISGSYGPPEKWKTIIPSVGSLSLDYVSHESLPEVRSQLSPQRVEAAVVCYANIVDKENFWQVLYALKGIEQATAALRLGPLTVFNPKHASIHWLLDFSHPSHEEAARKLVGVASSDQELPNLWNIRLNGRRRHIPENNNMWAVLKTDTRTPILEFDFLGADAWENYGSGMKEEGDMTGGEKLEFRKRQAQRLETIRLKQFYPYFPDDSGYKAPEWQTRRALMKPLLEKSPWLAVWDRQVRKLVRLAIRMGELQGCSPLDDVYDQHTKGDLMTLAELAQVTKSSGYTRAEAAHYENLFMEVMKEQDGWDDEGEEEEEEDDEERGVTYDEFVCIFMTEPPSVQDPTQWKNLLVPALAMSQEAKTKPKKAGKV